MHGSRINGTTMRKITIFTMDSRSSPAVYDAALLQRATGLVAAAMSSVALLGTKLFSLHD